uniref:HTTM domain-containing protein n=1 Tax=Flavobacterium sp. TaxID=239 RepID=UPI0040494727
MKLEFYKPVDIFPLILFRIFFGFVLFAEAINAMLSGWIAKVFSDTPFTFPFIGFEWLQPLPGNGMYFYYGVLAVLAVFIIIGFQYRIAMSFYTILWASVYLMQKTVYNNHFYLLLIVCFLMVFLPANQDFAVDSKRNSKLRSNEMPQWIPWAMILQISIIYFFGAIAKLYPDWLDGTATRIIFQNRIHHSIITPIFNHEYFHLFIAYAGIFFDGFIIFFLLWSRTRTVALIASLVFHLFNSFTLPVGVFPYFALSFIVFFYPAERLRRVFFQKPNFQPKPIDAGLAGRKLFTYLFVPFLIVQMVLPVRHWFIKGDVLWTEEGHRLSWRMMLRFRQGDVKIKIYDYETKDTTIHQLDSTYTKNQIRFLSCYPDGLWQFAQFLKEEKAKEGKKIGVFYDAYVSVNQHPKRRLVDPKVDFAQAKWNYFGHNDWILLYDENGNLIKK